MSWLRERVESKAGRTVPLPPRNEPWLPSVLAHVNPAVVSALTYAVIDERDQPDGRLSVVLSGWPRLDDLGRVPTQGTRVQGAAPHVEARPQPGARGAGLAGTEPGVVGGGRREVQLPACRVAGRPCARRYRPQVPARSGGRPTISSASTTRARKTTPANHWARSQSLCHRPADGRCGDSATCRESLSTSPPGGDGGLPPNPETQAARRRY